MDAELKAPFPYFGGKSKVAPRVWEIFGAVKNYVEPFAGTLAVLLRRPAGSFGVETVNDYSCFVVNAWRAISHNPLMIAEMCVEPCSEVDTEARHYHLLTKEMQLRDLLGDPLFYDPMLAVWWIKGACEWIGGGWASGEGPWQWTREGGWAKKDTGTGVNRQLPHLGNGGKGERERRVEWLQDWFSALSDRLCQVRITCGDWSRVAKSTSATTKLGVTAIFLDPPYKGTGYVYSGKNCSVSDDVNAWCASVSDPRLRIILCGRGDEHDNLLALGWKKEGWATRQGYSRDGGVGATSEALWHNVIDDNDFSRLLS